MRLSVGMAPALQADPRIGGAQPLASGLARRDLQHGLDHRSSAFRFSISADPTNPVAADTLNDGPQSTLSGVARVLVHAGKITSRVAEDLARTAREQRRSFVSAAVAAQALSPADLAHSLSSALAIPLLDLDVVDVTKLPQNLVDTRTLSQYQVLVLGKRGNRLFIGGADPTDQEAVDRISSRRN